MTTPNDIIVAAIARSSKNRADILSSPSEMLALVYRSLRGAYSIGAEINPTFFGASADVSYVSPGWARPVEAEAVFRLQRASDGVEVVLVPYDDQAAEPGLPAVYALAQVYRSAGNANDPTALDTLRIFYSKIPDAPATVDAALDATWPATFDPLLIEDAAAYLAMKDGRMDEAAGLMAERNLWLMRYVKFLEHETVNLRRRFAQVRRFNTSSMTALMSYLASGAPQ